MTRGWPKLPATRGPRRGFERSARANARSQRGSRVRIALAVLTATLVSALFAAPANATTFNWDGLLPDLGNNNCVWYYYVSSCSAFNPWVWHETEVTDGPLTKLLTGFENYNTIRGQWIYQGQTRGGDPSYYSMSGSLKAHVTWWDYNDALVGIFSYT